MFFSSRLRLKNNVLLKSIITLILGNSIGQIVSLFLQSFVTRIYSPGDMGMFSSLIAVISMWSVVSTGRYDLAILLPDEKKIAKSLIYLCFILSIFVSLLSATWYCFNYVSVHSSSGSGSGSNNSISIFNSYLFLFIPILIFLNACDLILTRLAVREKKIKTLSLSQIGRQVGDKITKITMGLWYQNPISLILGTIVGQIIRLFLLVSSVICFFSSNSDRVLRGDIVSAAKRYIKFPLIDTWSALLDVASSQLPVILLSYFFDNTITGYYGLCMAALVIPITIIGGSVGNVFVEKVARMKDNIIYVQAITLSLFKKLLFIGTFGMSIVVMYGDIIFSFLFGNNWKISGIYGMWRAPSLALVLAFSPLSSLFSIYEKLEEFFLLGIISFVFSICCIIFPYFFFMDALQTIVFLSIGILFSNMILLLRVLKVVNIPYMKTLFIVLYISIPIYVFQGMIAFFIRRLF